MTRCTCVAKKAGVPELYADVYDLPDNAPFSHYVIHNRRCPIHGHPRCLCMPVVNAEVDINKQIGWSALLCPVHSELEDAE